MLSQIFDTYVEFSETLTSSLIEYLADPDIDDEDSKETEEILDKMMKTSKELMAILVNNVLLQWNPNDVQEWEQRVALWAKDDDKIVETYNKALDGKFSKKPPKFISDLWMILLKSSANYDEAIRLMQLAVVPKNPWINYHDQSLPVQIGLFKSLKLLSLHVNLEESIGTVETTQIDWKRGGEGMRHYDNILELGIANAQVVTLLVVNYAQFLEESESFEESFKVGTLNYAQF